MDKLVARLKPLKGSASRIALRAVLTAGVAVGLVGCDVRIQTMTDSAGCEWSVSVENTGGGLRIISGLPVVGADGKPMCGAP